MISQYKENAKLSLKGNWGNAIIVFLGIYFLGSMINSVPQYVVLPSLTSSLTDMQYMTEPNIVLIFEGLFLSMGILFIIQLAITVFVSGILQLGSSKFAIKLARTDHADPDVIFDGFKNHYWTNVKAIVLVQVYSLLWMIPSFILFGLGTYMIFLENSMHYLFFGLGFVAMIFSYVKIMGYSMTHYVLVDETIHFETAKEYVDESIRLMKGNKWELIFLGLSFILWLFLIILTLGFILIYLGPYMNQTFANFYLHHKEVKDIAYE